MISVEFVKLSECDDLDDLKRLYLLWRITRTKLCRKCWYVREVRWRREEELRRVGR